MQSLVEFLKGDYLGERNRGIKQGKGNFLATVRYFEDIQVL
jgi:hypothetical protein